MAAKPAATKTPPKTPLRPVGSLKKALAIILIVCGLVGVVASLAITVEKFALLENPSATFGCDLNPVISCGSVMQSDQAIAFGFMNTYIGLLGFPVVVTIGVAMLAGAQFRRWFWLTFTAAIGIGVLFAYWLLFESIFRIKALCPYCLSVDLAITTAFWYLLLYVFEEKFITVKGKALQAAQFARRHHADILVLWFVLVTAFILQHFWYYYGQFFS
jgi:uncharacterized membrane protein